MSDAIEIEQLTAERDHYRSALAAQTARVKELEGLVRRAVAASGWLRTQAPRWIHVMNAFGLGATRAHELCASLGVDPEEMAGR